MTEDRRERIAQTIADHNAKTIRDARLAWNNLGSPMRVGYYNIADAVLDALADDLMPELPEWVREAGVSLFSDDKVYDTSPFRRGYTTTGYGPTIPAAIRNALEQYSDA